MWTALPLRAAPWLCAATLAGTAAGPARADANADLRLEDFGWSLVDLRPGDGVAPAVSFDTGQLKTRMLARTHEIHADAAGQPAPLPSDNTHRFSSSHLLFPAGNLYAFAGSGVVRAGQGGTVEADDFGVLLLGRARNTEGDAIYMNRFEGRAVPASNSFVGAIVLAPYTRLVWTGRLNLQAETTGDGSNREHERAMAAFSLRMLGADGQRLGGYYTRLDTLGQAAGTLTRERDLHIALSNPHGESLASTLELSLRIAGYTAVQPGGVGPLAAPVPEPGTVGLMLAGMGVVGVAARRGRRTPPGTSAGTGAGTVKE